MCMYILHNYLHVHTFACVVQMLKLQESPDAVPNGELPRHIQVYCDRYLCEKVVPGNRVTMMGIYSIRKGGMKPAKVHVGGGGT